MIERRPDDPRASSDDGGEVPEGPATRFGRRAIVLGAAAAGAGITAGLVTSAQPAEAANGRPVLLGEVNSATETTSISTTAGSGLVATTFENNESGVYGIDQSSGGGGTGVKGFSHAGTGVFGLTRADGLQGVFGQDNSSGGGVGVLGVSSAGTGVLGGTTADAHSGVSGQDTSSGGGTGVEGSSLAGTGVHGSTTADAHSGVLGQDNSSGGGAGVKGKTRVGLGVEGVATGNGTAVSGDVAVFDGLAGHFTNLHNSGGRDPYGGTAVRALASAGTDDQLRNDAGGLIVGFGAGEFAGQNGIIAAASGETGGGDLANKLPFGTAGVVGIGPNRKGFGVIGYGSQFDLSGVYGLASAQGGYGVWGIATGSSGGCDGVFGWNMNDPGGYGVYAIGGPGRAFNADGNAEVVGTLSKSGSSFKIDHPLDPANKFLQHSSVESPDMTNFYNGTVVLDDDGRVTVELPDFFEALNTDVRYQLTAIGGPAPNLHVAAKVAGNTFVIAGGHPGQEVSWQVTGIRQDAWANANRIPVEVDKGDEDHGRYLHPELFEDGQGQLLTGMARMRERSRRRPGGDIE
jgi:hypothetical protein